MTIAFVEKSFADYNDWSNSDKKIFKRIQRLIKETTREPFDGIGKPEPLKNNLQGYWSKRITDEHRLVYKVEESQLKEPNAHMAFSVTSMPFLIQRTFKITEDE